MAFTIALIGRPNVGKSTLFNRLIGRRQALVDETAGVTRDRIYGEAEWCGTTFRVIDTGGIDLAAHSLARAIRDQSMTAIAEADGLVCVLDGRDGLTPLDESLVAIARRSGRSILFAVNKIDTERQMDLLHAFAALGSDHIYPISAEHGRRIDALCDAIVVQLPRARIVDNAARVTSDQRLATSDAALRIAIIGRPNVGKSSLINRLAGAPRVVAHELPGTTRDAIDVALTVERHEYLFVDTAGIRRRAKTDERVEKFSVIKALQVMERADVVALVAAAVEGLTHQDRQLASRIVDAYRPIVVVVNKWDLIPQRQRGRRLAALPEALRELRRVPILPLSARTGWGCAALFPLLRRVAAATQRRLKTAALNQLLQEVQQRHHLPSYRSQPLRVYYATQTGVAPPTFLCFANYPAAIPTAYRRYLCKALEEALGAPGLPLKLIFRKRAA